MIIINPTGGDVDETTGGEEVWEDGEEEGGGDGDMDETTGGEGNRSNGGWGFPNVQRSQCPRRRGLSLIRAGLVDGLNGVGEGGEKRGRESDNYFNCLNVHQCQR